MHYSFYPNFTLTTINAQLIIKFISVKEIIYNHPVETKLKIEIVSTNSIPLFQK